MKVTYRELVECVPAFQELMELKFSPRVSVEFAEAASKVDAALDVFENKVQELSSTIEDVNLRNNEIETLLDEVVEIDVPQCSVSIINQPVSPTLFKGLSWFFSKDKSLLKTKPVKVL